MEGFGELGGSNKNASSDLVGLGSRTSIATSTGGNPLSGLVSSVASAGGNLTGELVKSDRWIGFVSWGIRGIPAATSASNAEDGSHSVGSRGKPMVLGVGEASEVEGAE